MWQLCFVNGAGKLAEVCTGEVLKDILHITLPNQRQDPTQQLEGIGAAGAAQVTHPESSGELQYLLDTLLQCIPGDVEDLKLSRFCIDLVFSCKVGWGTLREE